MIMGALGAIAAARGTLAGVVSPADSYVAPHLVSCPAGDSSFVVIPRNLAHDPEYAVVSVHLCSCPGYRLSQVGPHPYIVDPTGCVVSTTPDPETGPVLFPLAGGGLCPGDSLRVDADGVTMDYLTRVASFDQDGDLKVDGTDVGLVESKVGTTDPSADFDGDGLVTAADVGIAQQHLGHRAPDATTDAPLPSPGLVAMSPPQPNPFWRETQFRLTLDDEAPVDVSVYDPSGRSVATVFQGELSPGPHDFAWQGLGAGGTGAPSGIYFVQAQVGAQRVVRRVVFLRGR